MLGASPTLARVLLPGLLDWLENGVIDMAIVTNPAMARAPAHDHAGIGVQGFQAASGYRLVGDLGRSLNRLLVLATRLETRRQVAQTQVLELVKAEFSRLMRKDVLSFGSTASGVLE